MEKTNVKVRKWGNSFGVILPKNIIDEKNISEGSEIEITIQPKNIMKGQDLMELGKRMKLPRQKKSTQEILDEIDKEFEPE